MYFISRTRVGSIIYRARASTLEPNLSLGERTSRARRADPVQDAGLRGGWWRQPAGGRMTFGRRVPEQINRD